MKIMYPTYELPLTETSRLYYWINLHGFSSTER